MSPIHTNTHILIHSHIHIHTNTCTVPSHVRCFVSFKMHNAASKTQHQALHIVRISHHCLQIVVSSDLGFVSILPYSITTVTKLGLSFKLSLLTLKIDRVIPRRDVLLFQEDICDALLISMCEVNKESSTQLI